MGQIISQICEFLFSKPKKITHDDQLEKLIYPIQQNDHHIINIPNTSNSKPDNIKTTVTKEITHDDQLEKLIDPIQQNDHHIINIPNTSNSKPNNIKTTVTKDLTPNKLPSIVVDLSNVDTKVSNKKEVVKKEVIVKRIGPYTNMQKILLVGEGDFSFSTCLAVTFGSASNIIATSLNTQEFLVDNYGHFLSNKKKIESRGGTVIHGINARTMSKDPVLISLKYDRIIFNFPHAGTFGKTDSDLRKHKELVRGFLRNAKKMIKEDGEIHITHKSNGFFLEWDIPKIGSDQGLELVQEVKFRPANYPGYHTKYGFGGDKDFESTPCKSYKFRLLSK